MTKVDRRQLLAPHLAWFVNLRWITGIAVCCAGAIDRLVLGWYPHWILILTVGVWILVYNAMLWGILHSKPHAARRSSQSPDAGSEAIRRTGSNSEESGSLAHPRTGVVGKSRLLRLAVVQMLLDLACLALLVGWTGGLTSPILGFFVFHMVFASLLLPRAWAYLSALIASVFLAGCLTQTNQLPRDYREGMILLGLVVTLLLTVTLTNHITLDLRRQHRRLVRQNRRNRRLARHLRQHQRALVRQEKMVALGQMVAGVAHEIANPLASMDSLLQLAQRKEEKMSLETVGKLRDQVSRIHSIINQMRSMVHPTGGGEQPFPLNDVVAQAVEMVELDPRAKRLGIKKRLSPEVKNAMVRPQALQQVMVNLLLNSLDAIAEVPSPSLSIETRLGKIGYAIDVTDNGSGIKPEHMNRIFEPFFTTKPVGRGTGLGLSISYGLIQRQGGWIDVQSQLGVGTTMTIHLPSSASAPLAAGTASPQATVERK